MSNGAIGGIIVALIMVVCLVFVVLCVSIVPAGYVGVQYNMNGGIQE